MKHKVEESKEKAKKIAVELLKNPRETQKSVGKIMNRSQSTMSNWKEEAEHKEEISKLKRNLDDEKEYANQLASELNELELAMGLGGVDGTSYAETDY